MIEPHGMLWDLTKERGIASPESEKLVEKRLTELKKNKIKTRLQKLVKPGGAS
jgi:hypothetical protein